MSRAQRLLDLIQLLRSHRFAVTGEQLAAELGISIRTLYRDIATLQAQGARIDGAPGLGYILRPGFMLPPLMFSVDELEALVLGSRWVAERADTPLATAARQALAKIGAVLPDDLRQQLDTDTALIGPRSDAAAGDIDLGPLRQAIRTERKLDIAYRDGKGAATRRLIWPCALGYFDHLRVVVAWCELRGGFRHFRTDRIASLELVDQRYPQRRQALLQAWRDSEGIAAPAVRT
jgi:predicted DNA-binding transcriptional regulator YafY